MRVRTLLTAAVAVTVAIAAQAHAGPPTVDGSKVKRLEWSQAVPAQQHLQDAESGVDASACAPPDCNRYSFVWKPQRGLKGNILIETKWGVPGGDYDLSLLNDRGAGIAGCAGYGGLGEALVLPSTLLIPGKTYTVVTAFFLSAPDTMHNVIEFPTSHAVPTATPLGIVGGDCTIDGTIH